MILACSKAKIIRSVDRHTCPLRVISHARYHRESVASIQLKTFQKIIINNEHYEIVIKFGMLYRSYGFSNDNVRGLSHVMGKFAGRQSG